MRTFLTHSRDIQGTKFTLVEMLVVIAIIGILAALLMPSLNNAIETSRSASCSNNLRQISFSLNMYQGDNQGWNPDAWCWWRNAVPANWYGQPLFSTYGLGAYSSVSLFSACPSLQVPQSRYYGINEVVGAGGFGKATWPPKPASTRITQIKSPGKIIAFVDGRDGGDSWVARPLIMPMGGSFATERRYGWERHQYMPNMAYLDGHAERLPYLELDIYSWAEASVKRWRWW